MNKSLEDEKRYHNWLVFGIFGTIVAVGVALLVFTGALKADGTTAQKQKGGCNFAQEICRILDKQQRIAYDANHDRRTNPYNYTAGEMRTIRNHPGQLGNTAALGHYNNPGGDWQRSHTGSGTAKVHLTKHAFGSNGKRAGCANWERWTFSGNQDSTLGSSLFDYTMRVNACFQRAANGSWKVTALSANDTVQNKSGWTVQVQGWTQNVSPNVPNAWSRISTNRRIDNCVNGWKPVCSRGWTIQIEMVVFGVNHYNVEQSTWV